MADQQNILYVQTSNAPERQYSPLVLAQSARAMGLDAAVYYLGMGLTVPIGSELRLFAGGFGGFGFMTLGDFWDDSSLGTSVDYSSKDYTGFTWGGDFGITLYFEDFALDARYRLSTTTLKKSSSSSSYTSSGYLPIDLDGKEFICNHFDFGIGFAF